MQIKYAQKLVEICQNKIGPLHIVFISVRPYPQNLKDLAVILSEGIWPYNIKCYLGWPSLHVKCLVYSRWTKSLRIFIGNHSSTLPFPYYTWGRPKNSYTGCLRAILKGLFHDYLALPEGFEKVLVTAKKKLCPGPKKRVASLASLAGFSNAGMIPSGAPWQ